MNSLKRINPTIPEVRTSHELRIKERAGIIKIIREIPTGVILDISGGLRESKMNLGGISSGYQQLNSHSPEFVGRDPG